MRLINEGWFRVGGERYAKSHKTFGITTLRKGHVKVRGSRISFRFRAKHRVLCRTVLVDAELAAAMKELLALPGGRRLFRYEYNGELVNLGARRLNEYIREHMGDEFTAKDFRTWGGTLLAAIELAERGEAETATEQKRAVAAVMRSVGERLGNTPAVARVVVRQPGGRRAVSRRANDRRLSAAAICASCARGIPSSIPRSRRCSACCARGAFAGRAKPLEIVARVFVRLAEIPAENGG